MSVTLTVDVSTHLVGFFSQLNCLAASVPRPPLEPPEHPWLGAYAALRPRLIDELPIEALPSLRTAFELRGAQSTSNFLDALERRGSLSPKQAQETVNKILLGLDYFRDLPVLEQLRTECIRCFSEDVRVGEHQPLTPAALLVAESRLAPAITTRNDDVGRSTLPAIRDPRFTPPPQYVSVALVLHQVGLGDLVPKFVAEAVDLDSAADLSDEALRSLGVKVGALPRLKAAINSAIAAKVVRS